MTMKSNMIAVWGILFFVLAVGSADYGIESNVKSLVARRKNLEYMKQLVEDIDDQLNRLQKRTCYFNAGMSHSCDYKDIATAVDDTNYWSSDNTPGKRKRSNPGPSASSSLTAEGLRRLLRSMNLENRRR